MTLKEMKKIIELVLIPNCMSSIDRAKKEAEKFEKENNYNMFYGFQKGYIAGLKDELEMLNKTLKALEGN